MARSRFNPKADRWVVANEEDGVNLWGIGFFPPSFTAGLERYGGFPSMYAMIQFEGEHMRLLVPERRWSEVSQRILERELEEPAYFSRLKGDTLAACRALYRLGRAQLKTNWAAASDAKIAAAFAAHKQAVERMLGYGIISTLVEVPNGLFTNFVTELLTKRAALFGLKTPVARYFEVLTTPPEPSAQRQQELNFFSALKRFQGNRDAMKVLKKGDAARLAEAHPRLWALIRTHVRKFSWVYYSYNGPAFSEGWVAAELAAHAGEPAWARIRALERRARAVSREAASAAAALRLNAYERKLVRALRDTASTKLLRKDALTFSFYALEGALRELARRARLPFRHAQFIAPGEHGQALRPTAAYRRELAARTRYAVYSCVTDRPAVLSGPRAMAFVERYYSAETVGDVRELRGQPACVGKVTGKVKIVNVPADMAKMNRGDVLVSIATSPEIVSAMKRAAAIVTEQGGITSHASIVSRELGVPCVIGTRVATKVFRDGDVVSVDAETGTVRLLRRAGSK